MVTSFNTAGAPAKGGSGNGVLIVLGLIALGFAVWHFVIKPGQEKKKLEEAAHNAK